MKTTQVQAKVLLILMALAVTLPAYAGGKRGGHHHHGGGARWSVGIGIGYPGFGYFGGYPWYGGGYYPYRYAAPYYPYYPAYYPAPVVVQQPTTYIEQPAPQAEPQAATGYWYYCADQGAYYPYVKECPAGWQRVAPQPGN